MRPSQGLKVESHQAIRVVVAKRKDHTDRDDQLGRAERISVLINFIQIASL